MGEICLAYKLNPRYTLRFPTGKVLKYEHASLYVPGFSATIRRTGEQSVWLVVIVGSY
jgi:hypothetical protein